MTDGVDKNPTCWIARVGDYDQLDTVALAGPCQPMPQPLKIWVLRHLVAFTIHNGSRATAHLDSLAGIRSVTDAIT